MKWNITYSEIVREVYDVEALEAEAAEIQLAKEKAEAKRARKEWGLRKRCVLYEDQGSRKRKPAPKRR